MLDDLPLRPLRFEIDEKAYAEGSVVVHMGNTRVICNASLEKKLPQHRQNSNLGWITAEYSMLPRATHSRNKREAVQGKQSGRSQEIQRLIGRSLRMGFDPSLFCGYTVQLDCDVIQADGGTRCAAINGAMVATYLAFQRNPHLFPQHPIKAWIAAVSLGLKDRHILLDLDYQKDSTCDVDINIVMANAENFVEIQGSAEGETFSLGDAKASLEQAQKSIAAIVLAQKKVLNIS